MYKNAGIEIEVLRDILPTLIPDPEAALTRVRRERGDPDEVPDSFERLASVPPLRPSRELRRQLRHS